MSDRCRNRDCRSVGARRTANLTPPTEGGALGGGTPNCRGEYPQNGATGERHSLTHRLQALDFSIADTVLYLDAYPHCRAALDHYHKLIRERASLLRAMAEGGAPVTNFENASQESWDWTDGPWPWEPGAN